MLDDPALPPQSPTFDDYLPTLITHYNPETVLIIKWCGFMPHKTLRDKVLFLFHRWKNWDREKLSQLYKGTANKSSALTQMACYLESSDSVLIEKFLEAPAIPVPLFPEMPLFNYWIGY